MTFTYTILHINDIHYKCVMTIYNSQFLLNKKDIIKYIKSANYDIIYLNNEKITFATNIIAYDCSEINEIMNNMYDDIMYFLNLLQDDKKIMHHYPSIARI